MVNKKCMVIGAVPFRSAKIFREFNPDDYFVICADGGYATAQKFDIEPDLVVGDFDSLKIAVPDSVRKITLPVDKDVTDTMYAVMKALGAGFNDFVLIGCLGGARFDHSFASLEVLKYITNCGAKGILADEKTKIIVLKNSRLTITDSKGSTLSVFPFAGATCNVTYYGVKYPLTGQTLSCGGTLMGVSNRIVEDTAKIVVHNGTAIVMLYEE
ncbi:thiamine diphosphokinase [Scatolibacter rhodanostii]|uniref:thiamine diphosphokinase n=1 Tax=Scatolibacter rhodanostii TaxID=2014781 RepID=UPI000C06ACD7|nr:thiamine diphosphokinase [Scatolibacter rhodanostii]